MMPEIPWNLQGIDPEARARAEASAQHAGVNVSQWLNSMIRQQAAGQTHPSHGPQATYAPYTEANYPANPHFYTPQSPGRQAPDGWNYNPPFHRDPVLEQGLSHLNSQIGNLAARLDTLTRANADTAMPPQNHAYNHTPNRNGNLARQAPQTNAQPAKNADSGIAIRDIEKTLNNIVDLIEAADSRTNKSLGDVHSRIDALKSASVATADQFAPSRTLQPQSETQEKQTDATGHPRTRFEARRDRRLRGRTPESVSANTRHHNIGHGSGESNEAETPSQRIYAANGPAEQPDFVSLARSLEAALAKNSSAPPAVTASDIDNLKAEIKALAGQISSANAARTHDEPNYQALLGQLEHISSQLHSNSSVSGALTEIEQKIGLLFEQIQTAQQTPAKLENRDFDNAAQLADIENKLNLLFEQVQQSQHDTDNRGYRDQDETAHLLDIERKVSLLFDQFQQSQQDMLEASRQIAGNTAQSVIQDATENAVRMAAEHVARYLPERMSGNEIEIVRNLESGLREVRATAVETDMQTQKTLNAVQDSLHAILERLTYAEATPSGAKPAPISTNDQNGLRAASAPQVHDAPVVAPPVELSDNHGDRKTETESHRDLPLKSNDLQVQPELKERAQAEFQDEEGQETESLKIPESARPLEPGSGRPAPVLGKTAPDAAKPAGKPKIPSHSRDQAPTRTEPALGVKTAADLRNASTNEELLAAARRAARNAAATSASGKPEKKSLRERFRRSAKQPKVPASKSQPVAKTDNQTGDKVFGMPRKPVLLTAAAILLFVGSMKIYGLMANNTGAQEASNPASVTPPPTIEFDGDAGTAENTDTSDMENSPAPFDLEPVEVAPPNLNQSELDQGQRPNDQSVPAPQDITGSIPLAVANAAPAPDNIAMQVAPLPSVDVKSSDTAANPQSAHELPPEAIGNLQLRQAAAAGNAAAQFEVASRFAEGRGVALNPQLAAQWYQRAAAQGLAPAQYRLGSMYEKGHGVTQDRAAARIWYQRAAELGNRKAMHNLAVLYADGINGEPDMENAARWFRKAADFGLNDSQFNLGILYARGLGTPRNLAEAYKWLSIAAANGDSDASQRRDAIANELDQQTLAATRLAIQTWRAEPLIVTANTVHVPEEGWGEVATTRQQVDLPGRDIIQNSQKILTQLGFVPGPADGVWGPHTQTAITQFQARQNLPQTGQLTPQIYQSLQQTVAQNAGV
ncbi:MAG: peptidoglycan-binding protein [Fimbriimonadaceae bacterium]|nr:peptidoglycan-binding protein [Alphaproteobacteria bacterium]